MSEYERQAHRVQTAIAFLMANDPGWKPVTPKHMRVGIDMQKSDMGGLATLLIEKGVFTKDEYIHHMTEAAKREADMYEREVQVILSARNIRTG